jgi:hypothetical protein
MGIVNRRAVAAREGSMRQDVRISPEGNPAPVSRLTFL